MDISTFAKDHIPQITATAGLVTFALAKQKLTPGGILAAIASAVIHMLHPQPVYFWLLVTFFLLGVLVTKVGHKAKEHLTQSSTGSPAGEGARNAVQVLANSGCASVLILVDVYLRSASTPFISSMVPVQAGPYLPALQRVLPIGIVAQYAAVAADTCSSELGILSKSQPFLITAPWRKVPKGTNGGVTIAGLFAGFGGSFILVHVAIYLLVGLPPKGIANRLTPFFLTGSGVFGTLLDSVLGAVCQETVTDKRTGKVVEGTSGARVKIMEGGSRQKTGWDLLTNNGVNFVMAAGTSVVAMVAAYVLDLGI